MDGGEAGGEVNRSEEKRRRERRKSGEKKL